jgi:hypothetical protein
MNELDGDFCTQTHTSQPKHNLDLEPLTVDDQPEEDN